jgi:MarC family integral membrane protein
MHASSSLLSSFVTLFVTIGPIETAVIFASLTSGTHHKERRSLALRSVAIAGLMLLLFALGGNLPACLAARISGRGRNAAVPAGIDVDIFEPRSLLDKRGRAARRGKAR